MIREVLEKLKKLIWVLPGFLLWASFPPMGEHTDCLFALAPLLWFARRFNPKKSALVWFVNGLVFWGATLSWMPAIVKNGGPLPLVILGWVVLSIYCALYSYFSGLFISRYWLWVRGDVVRSPKTYRWRIFGLLFIEPIIWVGFEIIRSRFLGGFAWNQLGVAPINAGFGVPAVLGGVYLVSVLVVLVNGTIASVADRVYQPKDLGVPSRVRSIETLLPIVLIFIVFNWANKVQDNALKGAVRETGVGLVQRNFPSVFENDREENPKEVYTRLISTIAPLKPELIVLPESALCEIGSISSPVERSFFKFIRSETGAKAVLAGGSRREDGKEYNSAVLSFEDREEVYDKAHLVPFGEFIPGDKLFPVLQKFAPVGSCTPGEVKVLSFSEGIKLGVAICYEDTDSAQISELVKKGANLLVFITNDSWFSYSNEAVQHSWQAVARAIETGLPIVRVGNSGVTGIISNTGRATWLINNLGEAIVDKEASMFDKVKIPLTPRKTPYVIYGDKPLFFAFILTLAFIFYRGRNKVK